MRDLWRSVGFLAVEWRPWRVIATVQAACVHTSALAAAHFTWLSHYLPTICGSGGERVPVLSQALNSSSSSHDLRRVLVGGDKYSTMYDPHRFLLTPNQPWTQWMNVTPIGEEDDASREGHSSMMIKCADW